MDAPSRTILTAPSLTDCRQKQIASLLQDASDVVSSDLGLEITQPHCINLSSEACVSQKPCPCGMAPSNQTTDTRPERAEHYTTIIWSVGITPCTNSQTGWFFSTVC